MSRHKHLWGRWLVAGKDGVPKSEKNKKKHRLCINGWCPWGQYSNGRRFKARPERTNANPVPRLKRKHNHLHCHADCGVRTFKGPVCRVCLVCSACARAYEYLPGGKQGPCPGCKLQPEPADA